MQTTYKKEYCQLLIDHMAQGLGYNTFGATINIGRSTIYDWEKSFPDWVYAKEVAMNKSELFYEKRLVAMASGSTVKQKGFDVKLVRENSIYFALKTRFHKTYGDRQKIEQSTLVSMKDPVQINITTTTETRTIEEIETD